MAELEVRYVTTPDGVRIAYALAGSGPPLVTFSHPIASHVQLGWSHPVVGRPFREMARRHTSHTRWMSSGSRSSASGSGGTAGRQPRCR